MNLKALHNEPALLQRIAEGDERAFGELLTAYSDPLGTFVFKVTASREVATEIVQDAFIKIWSKREELPGIEHFTNYLFILTRNLTYNYIRNEARASVNYRKWLEEMEKMPEDIPMGTSAYEDSLARYLPVIEAAINQLSSQQKQVFELSRKQGLSHKAIAEKLNLSPETVKKYMKLALQSIREYVKNHVDAAIFMILLLSI